MFNRQLAGGWRLVGPYYRGALALTDWDTNGNPRRAYVAGSMDQSATHHIAEFFLPAPGAGTNPNSWPVVRPNRTIAPWWPSELPSVFGIYAYGLAWHQGKLWVSPRGFYDIRTPIQPLALYPYGEAPIMVRDPRTNGPLLEKWGWGFVKHGRPGEFPYLGGGGYESGTTGPGLVSAGPTLAVPVNSGEAVTVLDYGQGYYESPGASLEHWNKRCPRDPDYAIPQDGWLAWKPRERPDPAGMTGTKLEGRWCCDRIYGGGLVLPEGVCYWALTGIGEVDYFWQRRGCYPDTFTQTGKNRLYVYDRSFEQDLSRRLQLLGWQDFPLFDATPWLCGSSHCVAGQELGPDGAVYLSIRSAWASAQYRVDPAIGIWK